VHRKISSHCTARTFALSIAQNKVTQEASYDPVGRQQGPNGDHIFFAAAVSGRVHLRNCHFRRRYALLRAHPARHGPWRRSFADILCHQSGVLVFKNVTVKHKRMLLRRRSSEGDEELGISLDEHHILPSRQVGRW
jgi:hypothetical protein